MDICIDRTIINLVTFLISGTGLLSIFVLNKFNVPELRETFYDKNLFAIKHDKINIVMTWIFTTLAAIGLFIQVSALIWVHDIPDRLYGVQTYMAVFLPGLFIMMIVVFLLKKLGNMIARKYWLPEIVENLKSPYKLAISIVEHYDQHDDLIVCRQNIVDTHS